MYGNCIKIKAIKLPTLNIKTIKCINPSKQRFDNVKYKLPK